MLRGTKCVLLLTYSNVQVCRASSKTRKPNRIQKLMQEYKSVFGVLVETKAEKKKRLKWEEKGKIPKEKLNETNTELQWIKKYSSSNLKKIILSADSQDQQVKAIENTSESTLDGGERNEIDTIPNQIHTSNFIKPDQSRTKPTRWPKKNFKTVITKNKYLIDQNVINVNDVYPANFDQIMQEIKLSNTNTCDISAAAKDMNNTNNKIVSTTKYLDPNVAAESSNIDNNKPLNNTDTLSIENAIPKNDFPSDFERPLDIIIQNLPSFPLISKKQDSSAESTEIFSISVKDDPKTIKFPSVTKILSQTMPLESKLALEAWKERMIQKLGQEGFDMHQKALLEDGSSLHSCIAQKLLGKEYEIPVRIEPAFKSVECVLGNVSQLKAIETHVAHTTLRYKGIIDCIASYRGENYIIDWKRSEKKKLNLRETYDAPIQLAAYIGAINASNLYPFVIKRGLLVFAYTCGSPATVHEVCDNTLQQYWTAWLHRLQKYYVETANNDENKNTRQ